jgi:hypothetical protein
VRVTSGALRGRTTRGVANRLRTRAARHLPPALLGMSRAKIVHIVSLLSYDVAADDIIGMIKALLPYDATCKSRQQLYYLAARNCPPRLIDQRLGVRDKMLSWEYQTAGAFWERIIG